MTWDFRILGRYNFKIFRKLFYLCSLISSIVEYYFWKVFEGFFLIFLFYRCGIEVGREEICLRLFLRCFLLIFKYCWL